MGVSYSTTSVTGYNSSPPSDDGSQTAANQLEWDKHKAKLGDPVKTAFETSETNTASAFNSCVGVTNDTQQQIGGAFGFAASELTIAGGSITPTRSYHTVDTEGDASSDNLDTIVVTSVPDGGIVIISPENDGRTVVVRSTIDNIFLSAGLELRLDQDDFSVMLQRRGSNFFELGRAKLAGTASHGYIALAAKADMEAATATGLAITPAIQEEHPGHPKVVCHGTFNGSGADITYGHNAHFITRNGTGDYTVTFDVTMANATYAYHVKGDDNTTLVEERNIQRTTTTIRFEFLDQGGAAHDPERFNVTIYGTLA